MSYDTHYNVIVIGTGAGGGTLAYHLAPSGKKILLLERGDNWTLDLMFSKDVVQFVTFRARTVSHEMEDGRGHPLAASPPEDKRMIGELEEAG